MTSDSNDAVGSFEEKRLSEGKSAGQRQALPMMAKIKSLEEEEWLPSALSVMVAGTSQQLPIGQKFLRITDQRSWLLCRYARIKDPCAFVGVTLKK